MNAYYPMNASALQVPLQHTSGPGNSAVTPVINARDYFGE